MTLNNLKEQINSGCFDKDFQLLYSETKNSANRYSEACDKFADLYEIIESNLEETKDGIILSTSIKTQENIACQDILLFDSAK